MVPVQERRQRSLRLRVSLEQRKRLGPALDEQCDDCGIIVDWEPCGCPKVMDGMQRQVGPFGGFVPKVGPHMLVVLHNDQCNRERGMGLPLSPTQKEKA